MYPTVASTSHSSIVRDSSSRINNPSIDVQNSNLPVTPGFRGVPRAFRVIALCLANERRSPSGTFYIAFHHNLPLPFAGLSLTII